MEEIDYIDYHQYRKCREEYKKQLAKHNLTLAFEMIVPVKFNMLNLNVEWYKPEKK